MHHCVSLEDRTRRSYNFLISDEYATSKVRFLARAFVVDERTHVGDIVDGGSHVEETVMAPHRNDVDVGLIWAILDTETLEELLDEGHV